MSKHSFTPGPQGSAAAARRALLNWFRRNARSLPWRGRRDLYAVWVSEVMLQQTQVATVIPYYRRFLRAFPTLSHLARAPVERVLELWSGLGYYRRARNLHCAAQTITQKFGGHFPLNYDEARTLPGVGDYTARAVLSIAANLPYTILDGNVARVAARLVALRGNLSQPRFRRAVERELELLLSRRRPGAFNQALMELGQTVCLPRAPRCPACPIRRWCHASRLGRPEAFPEPRPRRAAELHHLAAAVIRRGGKVLMVRGLDDGLLSDVWNFPASFGKSAAGARCTLEAKLKASASGKIQMGNPVAAIRHAITYRSIRAEIYPVEIAGRLEDSRWFSMRRLNQSAASQLARKIAEEL